MLVLLILVLPIAIIAWYCIKGALVGSRRRKISSSSLQ